MKVITMHARSGEPRESAMLRPGVSRPARLEVGFALMSVLVILMVVGGTAVSFVWYMNQQQTRVGVRYHSAIALAAADAGINRALAILESVSPDGAVGRTWRPSAFAETMQVGPIPGRFTLSLTDGPQDAITIISVGEAAGVTRRLRARVYVASPALLAALYATSVVRLDPPPATTFILRYGAGHGGVLWTHIAAGGGLWLPDTDVSINDPSLPLETGPGPIDAPGKAGSVPQVFRDPLRLLLARDAELWVGQAQQRVDLQQVRISGASAAGEVVRTETFPRLPEVDRAFYRDQAAANTANAELNAGAAMSTGDAEMARKRDSLYTAGQFSRLQLHLAARSQPLRLRGVIYVRGGFALLEGQRMEIIDGAIIAENTVHLAEGAVLEITHSASTRRLPGLVVLDNGALVVTRGARLRVHGLVYASRVIDIGSGARLDVVGAVAGNDRGMSFRNLSAKVVIRYDPAVLGTPGLRPGYDSPVIAWVASWEELP